MASFLKKDSTICFSKKELAGLFRISSKQRILRRLKELGMILEDLIKDPWAMLQITADLGHKSAQDRDEHEIFSGLFVFSDFYGEESEVCFELKGFNPNKDHINSLEDLIKFRHGVNTSDFQIKTGEDRRKFELKRYRGSPTLDEVSRFIQEKVEHYGDLGDTNLLIVFQFAPYTIVNLDFHELHARVAAMNFKFKGNILIFYNNNNQKNVIITVYPELEKTEITKQPPSTRVYSKE